MKTGIFYWFGYNVPMAERFKLIASGGFDNVLLWWGDQFRETDRPKEELPDLARKAGIFVENIHTDFDTAALCQIVINNSSKVIILCDSSKFGKTALVSYAGIEAVNMIITDNGLEPQIARMTSAGTEVILADPEQVKS